MEGNESNPLAYKPLSEDVMHIKIVAEKFQQVRTEMVANLTRERARNKELEDRLVQALQSEKVAMKAASDYVTLAKNYALLDRVKTRLMDDNLKLKGEIQELRNRTGVEAAMAAARCAALERSAKEAQRALELEKQTAREQVREAREAAEREKKSALDEFKKKEEEARLAHEEELASLRDEIKSVREECAEEVNLAALEFEDRNAQLTDRINALEAESRSLQEQLSASSGHIEYLESRMAMHHREQEAERNRLMEVNRSLMLQQQSLLLASTARAVQQQQRPRPRAPPPAAAASSYPQLSMAWRQRGAVATEQPVDEAPAAPPSPPPPPVAPAAAPPRRRGGRKLFDSDMMYPALPERASSQVAAKATALSSAASRSTGRTAATTLLLPASSRTSVTLPRAPQPPAATRTATLVSVQLPASSRTFSEPEPPPSRTAPSSTAPVFSSEKPSLFKTGLTGPAPHPTPPKTSSEPQRSPSRTTSACTTTQPPPSSLEAEPTATFPLASTVLTSQDATRTETPAAAKPPSRFTFKKRVFGTFNARVNSPAPVPLFPELTHEPPPARPPLSASPTIVILDSPPAQLGRVAEQDASEGDAQVPGPQLDSLCEQSDDTFMRNPSRVQPERVAEQDASKGAVQVPGPQSDSLSQSSSMSYPFSPPTPVPKDQPVKRMDKPSSPSKRLNLKKTTFKTPNATLPPSVPALVDVKLTAANTGVCDPPVRTCPSAPTNAPPALLKYLAKLPASKMRWSLPPQMAPPPVTATAAPARPAPQPPQKQSDCGDTGREHTRQFFRKLQEQQQQKEACQERQSNDPGISHVQEPAPTPALIEQPVEQPPLTALPDQHPLEKPEDGSLPERKTTENTPSDAHPKQQPVMDQPPATALPDQHTLEKPQSSAIAEQNHLDNNSASPLPDQHPSEKPEDDSLTEHKRQEKTCATAVPEHQLAEEPPEAALPVEQPPGATPSGQQPFDERSSIPPLSEPLSSPGSDLFGSLDGESFDFSFTFDMTQATTANGSPVSGGTAALVEQAPSPDGAHESATALPPDPPDEMSVEEDVCPPEQSPLPPPATCEERLETTDSVAAPHSEPDGIPPAITAAPVVGVVELIEEVPPPPGPNSPAAGSQAQNAGQSTAPNGDLNLAHNSKVEVSDRQVVVPSEGPNPTVVSLVSSPDRPVAEPPALVAAEDPDSDVEQVRHCPTVQPPVVGSSAVENTDDTGDLIEQSTTEQANSITQPPTDQEVYPTDSTVQPADTGLQLTAPLPPAPAAGIAPSSLASIALPPESEVTRTSSAPIISLTCSPPSTAPRPRVATRHPYTFIPPFRSNLKPLLASPDCSETSASVRTSVSFNQAGASGVAPVSVADKEVPVVLKPSPGVQNAAVSSSDDGSISYSPLSEPDDDRSPGVLVIVEDDDEEGGGAETLSEAERAAAAVPQSDDQHVPNCAHDQLTRLSDDHADQVPEEALNLIGPIPALPLPEADGEVPNGVPAGSRAAGGAGLKLLMDSYEVGCSQQCLSSGSTPFKVPSVPSGCSLKRRGSSSPEGAELPAHPGEGLEDDATAPVGPTPLRSMEARGGRLKRRRLLWALDKFEL
ncbi:proline-rich protein 36-like [Frankliniella occidentalis]|uniref:Proline-rich protein 36-like n=1 Tax=Frankliniella occidentalis TaxID=133901 RepID=A0A9C6TZN7_FRAOC|nr:proline-rich protein 36-like [Frankliniella occidentalis]